MLTISKAALFAAMLGLSAPMAFGVLPVAAQEDEMPEFSFSLEVPTVASVGSSMSDDQLRDVFTSNFLEHADALARLTATSVTIPEITMRVAAHDGSESIDSTIVYRDLVFTNVRDGYAEKMVIGEMVSTSEDGVTTYGATTEDGFDIRRTLEFAGMVKGDASAPMKPLYNSFTISGGKHEGDDYTCSFGPMVGSGAEARPVGIAFSDVVAAVQTFTPDAEPAPEALGTVVGYVSDLLRALRGGAMTVGAIDCTTQADGATATVKLAGANSGDFEPGVYPSVGITGLSVDAGEMGNATLDAFNIRSIDFNPTLEALDSAAGQLNEKWFEDNWRKLIPSWGGLSLSGLDIDVVSPDMPANPAVGQGERVQAKVGSFDIDLGKYFLGIPTDVSVSASGIDIPLPEDASDPQLNVLRDAGITRINMGFDAAASWDEAAEVIAVEKLAIAMADLGGLSISANLTHASKDLFALDPNIAMSAGFGIMVRDVTINARDEGFGEIVWPMAAAEQGVTDVKAFREQMASVFEGLAIQLIGRTDAARQLGVSLGEFVAGGKSEITINMKSKNPDGIPMAMFIAAQNDPSILAGQIDITGSAN